MKRSACSTVTRLAGLLLSQAAGLLAAGSCPERAPLPEAPLHATDLNGIAWPDFCFEKRELEEHFFIIGDWGGLFRGWNVPPIPAPDSKRRNSMVPGVDDKAQVLVAEQMKKRAKVSKPRYILNVGDNFYWGGLETTCGSDANHVKDSVLGQWHTVYESVYDGPDLAGLPWLGVLGNHDYGGYKFTTGWDQAIAYTWSKSGRWLTPAQYWSTKVHYHDFSVDYLFVESNLNDAFPPQDLPGHNICSQQNNPDNATCGATGPTSPLDCSTWFIKLWLEQLPWIAERLSGSQSDWRIVVTHYPPDFRQNEWQTLVVENNIDLIVTGHRHNMEVSNRDPAIGGAAWLVSGGGGGITSEGVPRLDGQDDQYGFFDVTISKSALKLEAISHGGILRSTTVVSARTKPTTTTVTVTATNTATTLTSTTATTLTTTASSSSAGFLPAGRHHNISGKHQDIRGDMSRSASMHVGFASGLSCLLAVAGALYRS